MPEDALAQIRGDLPLLALGVLLAFAGLAACLAAVFNWRPNGRLLLGFGAFTGLYGLRLFAWAPSGRILLGGSAVGWHYFEAFSTYVVPVPAALFFVEYFGRGYRSLLVWAYRAVLAYAIVAIVWSLASGNPFAGMDVYRPVVVLANVAIAAQLVVPGRPVDTELRVLRATYLVFIGLAFNATLGGELLPWSLSAEVLGFAVFMMGIGYVSARRVFRTQRQLAELSKELETARAVQQMVLPRELPALDGLRIAARYVPAAEVAGDLYDVIVLDERRALLLVADVSGHGVPAALIASMVKVAFAAEAERSARPDEVLSGVNRILCGNLKGQFVTAVCAYVDLERRLVRYTTAGHPPLLHRRRGQVAKLSTEGIFLGVLPEARYRSSEVSLERGDLLVLYTDGILEAAPPSGELFGIERFVRLLEERRVASPEELAAAILDAVQAWHFGSRDARPLDDDVTLVVVETTA